MKGRGRKLGSGVGLPAGTESRGGSALFCPRPQLFRSSRRNATVWPSRCAKEEQFPPTLPQLCEMGRRHRRARGGSFRVPRSKSCPSRPGLFGVAGSGLAPLGSGKSHAGCGCAAGLCVKSARKWGGPGLGGGEGFFLGSGQVRKGRMLGLSPSIPRSVPRWSHRTP